MPAWLKVAYTTVECYGCRWGRTTLGLNVPAICKPTNQISGRLCLQKLSYGLHVREQRPNTGASTHRAQLDTGQ